MGILDLRGQGTIPLGCRTVDFKFYVIIRVFFKYKLLIW